MILVVKVKYVSPRGKDGILQYRRGVPPELRSHYKKREIIRSLHTTDILEAKSIADPLTKKLNSEFKTLRDAKMKIHAERLPDYLPTSMDSPEILNLNIQAFTAIVHRKVEKFNQMPLGQFEPESLEGVSSMATSTGETRPRFLQTSHVYPPVIPPGVRVPGLLTGEIENMSEESCFFLS